MKVPTIVLRRTIYMVDNYLTSDFVINNLREKFDFFLNFSHLLPFYLL